MSRSRSAQLAVWGCAWRAGQASSDELLRAVVGDDRPHGVSPLAGERSGTLSDMLLSWRRADALPRVVFPIPGDVRGLSGSTALSAAAVAAGEALVAGPTAWVPTVVDHRPSSAGATVSWQAFDVAPGQPDLLPVEQAAHELTEAIREAASELARLGAAGGRDVREALAGARRAGEQLDLPPTVPPRAVALIAQAERLAAALSLAADDHHGGAVDRESISVRAARLRPAGELSTAVRRARQAGYNSLWHPSAAAVRQPEPTRGMERR